MGYPMTQWMLGTKQRKLGKLRDEAQAGYDADQAQIEANYGRYTGSARDNWDAYQYYWYKPTLRTPTGLKPTEDAQATWAYGDWAKSFGPHSPSQAQAAGHLTGWSLAQDPSSVTHYGYGEPLPVPEEIGKYNTAIDKIQMLAPMLGAYGSGTPNWNPNQNAGYDWMKYLEQFKR